MGRLRDRAATLLGVDAQKLYGNATGTFALRILGVLLGFSTSVLLARLLGSAGYGQYSYAVALAQLLVIPATLGLGPIAVRYTAQYTARKQWSLLKGFFVTSDSLVLLASMVVASVAAGALLTGSIDAPALNSRTVLIALALLPILALSTVRQGRIQGVGLVALSRVPEVLLRQGVMVIGLGIWFVFSWPMLPADGMTLNVFAAGAGLVALVVLSKRLTQRNTKDSDTKYAPREWLGRVAILLVLAIIKATNAKVDILLLGAMRSAEEVGLYDAASRVAGTVSFILIAVSAAAAPMFATHYAAKRHAQLRSIVTRSARLTMFATLPIVLGLLIFGAPILGLFGDEFPAGYWAMCILILGHVMNAAAGPLGVLLLMTGRERHAAVGMGLAALVNVGANLVLIPRFGMNGAAIANAASLTLWNIMLTLPVRKELGLDPTFLGLHPKPEPGDSTEE